MITIKLISYLSTPFNYFFQNLSPIVYSPNYHPINSNLFY